MLFFKRSILFFVLILVVVISSGCGITDSGKEAYDYKTAIVALEGEFPDRSGVVGNLAYLGERDIKYRFKLDGEYIATEASGTANLVYNASYILNLPAKLIHNIRYDYLLTQETFEVDEEVERNLEGQIGNVLLDASMVVFIIMDIVYAIIGCFLSLIMLMFGSLIGLIVHPIQTIMDIPAAIISLIQTVIAAVVNIFSW